MKDHAVATEQKVKTWAVRAELDVFRAGESAISKSLTVLTYCVFFLNWPWKFKGR